MDNRQQAYHQKNSFLHQKQQKFSFNMSNINWTTIVEHCNGK